MLHRSLSSPNLRSQVTTLEVSLLGGNYGNAYSTPPVIPPRTDIDDSNSGALDPMDSSNRAIRSPEDIEHREKETMQDFACDDWDPESMSLRARDLPTEVLLIILKEAIDSLDNNLSTTSHHHLRTLRTLSLVCREWRKKCAPRLFRVLQVRSSRIRDLICYLRVPDSLVHKHARILKVAFESAGHVLLLGGLAKSLPNIVGAAFSLVEMQPKTSQSRSRRHTSYSTIVAGLYSMFANISSLTLWHQEFPSSSDLLRALSALPSLTSVFLDGVIWESNSLTVVPGKVSMLSIITCYDCLGNWPLLLFSAWSHFTLEDTIGVSNELPAHEACLAALICQCTSIGKNSRVGFHIRIHKSLYSNTYVIVVGDSYRGRQLEFHISKLDCRGKLLSHAHICWVVLRSVYLDVGPDAFFQTHEDIESMDVYLSQLPHLNKVLLETERADDGEELLESLRIVRNAVRLRSWGVSERYSRDAYRHGVVETTKDRFPISPLWYHHMLS